MNKPKILISAGEASGDALGHALLVQLKQRCPDLEAFGMGGPGLQSAGHQQLASMQELNVMGFVEVIRHLPRLLGLLQRLARETVAQKPDLAVLIDVPDFHLRLAKKLHHAGIPVVLYVAPSVWAWRAGRVKKFKKWFRRVLLLFPFELPIWQRANVDAHWVGHPLVRQIPEGIWSDTPKQQITLMPGSRRSEIKRHLPILLQAAKKLLVEQPNVRFVLPVAPSLDPQWFKQMFVDHQVPIDLITHHDAHQEIEQSICAWVASGTATLEVALLGCPQLIFYRVHPLSYFLGRPLMKTRFFGLPNILMEEGVVPEHIQQQFNVENLLQFTRQCFSTHTTRQQSQKLAQDLRKRLDAPVGRAAELIIELLNKPQSW